MSKKIVIMGAAGRDFHVFNCCYRDKPEFDVVAFTTFAIFGFKTNRQQFLAVSPAPYYRRFTGKKIRIWRIR